jgi:predicted TIM-barrel fold metal-dependent hydrolase
MLIVDSQIHIWGPDTPQRAWQPGRAAEAQKPYPIDKETLLFQMDLAGVQGVVLVPPSWEGDRNDLVLEAAAANPERFAAMGRFDVGDPASRDRVAGWRDQPGMLGIRLTFHNEYYRHLLTDGSADWFWDAAERADIPLMVLVPGALDVLDRIAGRHPGLKLAIDHVGLGARGKAPEVFDDLPAVCALAKRSNVAVKASGMPSLSRQEYPFSDLHDAIKMLVESFGPRRVFFGTDLTRMPCTYYECITLFTQHLPWLKGEDLEWVMGRGVCEWLRWDALSPKDQN